MNRSHYTFGDNSLAARRLNLLASTFDPSSALLLESITHGEVRTALDVGCGPGHTTRLVADVSSAQLTIGFDQSQSFIELARASYGNDASLEFRVCNVLEGPLPLPNVELVYCRFLLTHLAEPRRALANLIALLAPGARLVLEEVERLSGDTSLLRRYYELVTALQASHGQSTTIGASLHEHLEAQGGTVTVTSSRCNRLLLTGTQMPELHLMNIATWKQDPKIAAIASQDELDSIQHGLEQLVASGSANVECALRQIVLTKN